MKLWQEALVLLLGLALVGCRTDPRIALVERDNRELQDTIYELQACIEKYDRNLERCQQQNAALQSQLKEAKNGESPAASDSAPPAEKPAPSRRKSTPTPPVAPQDLAPPVIEVPPESNSTNQMPSKKSGGTAPQRTPGPMLTAPKMQSAAPAAGKVVPVGRTARPQLVRNSQVAKILLDERFTGALEQEGVSVAIELRDAQGRACRAAAPISVVVLDPALPGDAARVARWDFSAEDVAAMLQQSPAEEGLRLAMPWPKQAPVHKKLRLFVRYTTDQGQKLQAECPIELEPARQQVDLREPGLLPPHDQNAEELSAVATSNVEAEPAEPTSSEPARRKEAVASRPSWSPERQ